MKGAIFAYVLAYGGALCSLFNPFIGLLVYVCFAILKPDLLWSWSLSGGGRFSLIVAVAMCVGWMLNGFGQWRFGRARVVVAAFVGFWVWSILSAMGAPTQQVAWTFVSGMGRILLPFIVGITLIDSIKKVKQLAWTLMLSQAYLAFEFNLSYYSGFNIVQQLGFGGMDNNTLAIGMVTGAGLALFLGLGADRWWHTAVAFVGALLMIHVVFFSFSRGGMLAAITLGLISFVIVPKRPRHTVIFAVAVLLALRLAGPEVRERFGTAFVGETDRDFSAQSRVELWRLCWDLMLEHPVLGVGPEHFGLVVHEYGWPAGKEAHTLWLQTGAELGFPGLFFLLALYGACIVRLLPLARGRGESHDPWSGHAARMVIAALVGFAVSAQFVTVEGLELPYYIALVGAGVLKLATSPSSPKGQRSTDERAGVRRQTEPAKVEGYPARRS
jgi:putative inorganic carbon (hco3(-)) transporter